MKAKRTKITLIITGTIMNLIWLIPVVVALVIGFISKDIISICLAPFWTLMIAWFIVLEKDVVKTANREYERLKKIEEKESEVIDI